MSRWPKEAGDQDGRLISSIAVMSVGFCLSSDSVTVPLCQFSAFPDEVCTCISLGFTTVLPWIVGFFVFVFLIFWRNGLFSK